MKKVVVVVEGGNVQSVYADTPGDVVVVDHDNLKEEGHSREEREKIESRAVFGLDERGFGFSCAWVRPEPKSGG